LSLEGNDERSDYSAVGNEDIGEPDYCEFDRFICDGESCYTCDRNMSGEAQYASMREDEAEWVRKQGR
jgi:hypothetical protein